LCCTSSASDAAAASGFAPGGALVPPRFAATSRPATRHTDWARRLRDGAIGAEEIRQSPEKYLVLYRQSMQPWLFPAGLPKQATCFFSYWPGYLEEERLRAFVAQLDAARGQLLQRHASGHAHPDDLRRFAERDPTSVAHPVHTTSPEKGGGGGQMPRGAPLTVRPIEF
jgi:hypothetical protein